MPLDGEQLDDLLSGFIDDVLTDAERALVEETARADVRIAQRIEDMRQQTQRVHQYGRAMIAGYSTSPSPLKRPTLAGQGQGGLAERVIREARLRASEMNLPNNHYLQAHSGKVSDGFDSEGRLIALPHKSSKLWPLLVGLASAAAVLVAVSLPRFQQEPDRTQLSQQPLSQQTSDSIASDSLIGVEDGEQSLASDPDATPFADSQEPEGWGSSLVGKSGGMEFVLVVDVEISAVGEQNHALEKILASSGIPLAPAIAANRDIFKALEDSRMIVRNNSSSAHPIAIQAVRGDVRELDMMLRGIWQDRENFPNVALNLSIDSRAILMREMLRSAQAMFGPKEPFAIPLAVDQSDPNLKSAGEASELPADSAIASDGLLSGSEGRVQYISSSQRANGWDGMGELSAGQSDSMATILLVVHQVE